MSIGLRLCLLRKHFHIGKSLLKEKKNTETGALITVTTDVKHTQETDLVECSTMATTTREDRHVINMICMIHVGLLNLSFIKNSHIYG
jgi:hypothetical protein